MKHLTPYRQNETSPLGGKPQNSASETFPLGGKPQNSASETFPLEGKLQNSASEGFRYGRKDEMAIK